MSTAGLGFGRAFGENELGAGTMPCAEFGANAAWLRITTLVYNLLSALKTLSLPPNLHEARPRRLRFVLFSLAGRVLGHARSVCARLAARLKDVLDISRVRTKLLEHARALAR